jgi:hypothetical protein
MQHTILAAWVMASKNQCHEVKYVVCFDCGGQFFQLCNLAPENLFHKLKSRVLWCVEIHVLFKLDTSPKKRLTAAYFHNSSYKIALNGTKYFRTKYIKGENPNFHLSVKCQLSLLLTLMTKWKFDLRKYLINLVERIARVNVSYRQEQWCQAPNNFEGELIIAKSGIYSISIAWNLDTTELDW